MKIVEKLAGVRELDWVELEACPGILAHPETVKMKYGQGYIAAGHLVELLGNYLFTIVGDE